MKKLIMLSSFLIGTIVYGGNDIVNHDIEQPKSNTVILEDSNEMFAQTHKYQIVIWRSFYDPVSGYGSSWGSVAIPSTPCYTESEAETFRVGIEGVYQSMNTEPNTSVWAVKEIVEDCI